MKFEDLSSSNKELISRLNSEKNIERLKKSKREILIIRDRKIDDLYYDISTLDKLKLSALDALRHLYENWGFFKYKEELPDPLGYSAADIENYPESLKQEATEKLKRYSAKLKNVIRDNDDCDLATYALKNKDGLVALYMIELTNSYSFEYFQKV